MKGYHMRVRVEVVLDIDIDAWSLSRGGVTEPLASEIRQDVKDHAHYILTQTYLDQGLLYQPKENQE